MERYERRFTNLFAQVLCWNVVRQPQMDHLPRGIQLLGATAFGHLWGSKEVVEAFTIWLAQWQVSLGASLEGITESERNPGILNARAGAAAVSAAELWHSDSAWLTTTGWPRHETCKHNVGGLLWWTVSSSQPGTPAHLHSAKAPYNADMANENRNRHS